MPVTRFAAIDIGTNTVLLLVAERGPGGELVAVEEHATITRLGQGVDKTRVLAPEAVERTNACLDRYAEIVRRLGAEHVAVVGTSAMRDAGGGEVVRAHVKEKLGVEARTISGDEEARLTFAGALSGIQASSGEGGESDGRRGVIVFDIGGGSTEVVHGHRSARSEQSEHGDQAERPGIELARSFDVGSVRLTERLVRSDPPSKEEREAVYRAARDAFAALPPLASNAPPVGIAGTMTTLAAVSLHMTPYDPSRIHGLEMPKSELERVVDELSRVTLEERRNLPGLEPKRADVIIAGGLVALAFLDHLRASRVTISDRGVRWGLAEELAAAAAATR